MAAPVYTASSTGATDAGGAWTASGYAGSNRVSILHVLQDGTTAGAVTLDSITNIEALDGTDNTMTSIGSFTGGGLIQHLWIGRHMNANTPVATGSNSSSEDLFWRFYVFINVNTGTTLASVIEQNGTTTPSTTSGTSGTIADAGVTTTGPDRLALNFVSISDDNAIAAFTGMTGGTWTEAVAEYAESSGTDGSIGLQIATMATAGTIDGGTTANADATDGWGVVGFALIGTTPNAVRTISSGAIMHATTAVA